jgi:L-lactate dehydrogenase complex protein LldE
MSVALFVPCFVNVLYPRVAASARSLLEAQGLEVAVPLDQTCCGQPAFNTGYWKEAELVADHMIDVFADAEHVVAPSGSCATMIKHFYPRLFPEGHARREEAMRLADRVYEFCSFFVDVLGVEDVGASYTGRATYHDACHALRELRIKEAPRKLLAGVRGLELVEMEESETCCGFGGTFAVKNEAISVAMGEEKLQNAAKTRADLLVTTDSSCLLHLEGLATRNGKAIRCLHIAELLAGAEPA